MRRGASHMCEVGWSVVQRFSKFLQRGKRKVITCTGHIKGLGMCSIAFRFCPVARSWKTPLRSLTSSHSENGTQRLLALLQSLLCLGGVG
jgi:hypothetical protein